MNSPGVSENTATPARTPALTVKAFGVTDKGKVRANNEDQFLIAELTKAMRVWQTSLPEPKLQVGEERAHLFLVADGMGGHRAGERASALAVVAIEQFTLNTFKWFFDSDSAGAQKDVAQFQSALRQADDRLWLCSDGLTEMVTNEAIAATLAAEPVPEGAAKRLLMQANDGGARDNITVLIVRFDSADSDAGTGGDGR